MHIVHPVIKALSRCIFELVKQIDVNVIDGFVFRPVGSRLKSVYLGSDITQMIEGFMF